MNSDYPDGPGLKYLNRTQRWYGGGYCGICGDRGEGRLIARAVRFWDPDDGWKVGILCRGCTDEFRERGPRPGDYAVITRAADDQATRIDISAADGDLDATAVQD